MLKKYFVAACLCAAAVVAHAETSVLVYGVSKHFSPKEKMNEANYGMGIEQSKFLTENLEVTGHLMAYKDSYSALGAQAALGLRYTMLRINYASLAIGATAGAMTGSDMHVLGAYPYLEVKSRDVSLRIHYVPPINGGCEVVALSTRIEL